MSATPSHLLPTEPITLPDLIALGLNPTPEPTSDSVPVTNDPHAAWAEYQARRNADPVRRFGFNPRSVFEAGYAAGQADAIDGARASGWANHA